ncbi:MAG: hypothetical protein ABH867_04985, partial [Patescibacteria group bacterium]
MGKQDTELTLGQLPRWLERQSVCSRTVKQARRAVAQYGPAPVIGCAQRERILQADGTNSVFQVISAGLRKPESFSGKHESGSFSEAEEVLAKRGPVSRPRRPRKSRWRRG